MHLQLRKIYVPLSCPSLAVIWPSFVNCWSRVTVHPCYRCLLFLWSVKPFYSGMTRRNKLQYLIHIQDWVKVVVSRRSKCQPSFCSVLPWSITIFYIGIIIGIAHHPMNSWYSDTSCHHCSFVGPRVDATGIPTNELWCVKSILLATLLLGS